MSADLHQSPTKKPDLTSRLSLNLETNTKLSKSQHCYESLSHLNESRWFKTKRRLKGHFKGQRDFLTRP
jgi:hypothetical protein